MSATLSTLCEIQRLANADSEPPAERLTKIFYIASRLLADQLEVAMELGVALEASVKLQSHYATLLNQHDGGARVPFANADAWISRLRETGKLPPIARK